MMCNVYRNSSESCDKSGLMQDTLSAMIHQESSEHYRFNDYSVSSSGHSIINDSKDNPSDQVTSMVVPVESNTPSTGTIESWREKICMWMYSVTDHFDFSREIVAITMNYFDRYLSRFSKTSLMPISSRLVQLVAVAALNIALKIHTSRSNHFAILLELSRGSFSAQNIIATENAILNDLGWKLSAPTSLAFLHSYILLIPKDSILCQDRKKQEIGELAQFLIELSVCDYFFVRKNMKPSSIALAALLNAINMIRPSSASESQSVETFFLKSIETSYGKAIHRDADTKQCEHRFFELYEAGGYGRDRTSSPHSVTMSQ